MSEPAARRYVCTACGFSHERWAARCSKCQAWGMRPAEPATPREPPAAPVVLPPHLAVVPSPPADPKIPPQNLPVPLSEIAEVTLPRYELGLFPFDAVLGGGIVTNSIVLLFAIAGLGKSTIAMKALASSGRRVLYATGEETIVQVAQRSYRIGSVTPRVHVVAENDPAVILGHAKMIGAEILCVDSVQTLVCSEVNARAGSPTQVKACCEQIVQWAKLTNTAVLLIGQVTGDGELAGPSTLRHLVDVVVELEGIGDSEERILRCAGKNRFGSATVIGKLRITERGVEPVDGDGWDEPL